MGYFLKAFIGERKNLISIQKLFKKSKLIDLNDKFSIIPYTDELFNEYNSSRIIYKFEYLTEEIEQIVVSTIKNYKIAYIESEFFGGEGGHIGIIWKNGEKVYLGEFNKETMNIILKKIGVKRTKKHDEFDTIGLDRFRQTSDWVE